MTFVYLTTSYPKMRVLMQKLREKIAIEVPYNSIYDVSFRGNRIDVRQLIGDKGYVLIRSYIIILIPVVVNLSAIQGFSGDVYFDCDDVLSELSCAIKKLDNINCLVMKDDNKLNMLLESLQEIETEIEDERDSMRLATVGGTSR